MRRILTTLALLVFVSQVSAQENVPARYKGCHQLTRFDSISVIVEESGLSHVNEHYRIDMLDYAGCTANNVVKVDYDPLSAYVEIQRVLVHRMMEPVVDTIVWDGEGTVYDYVAPARLIYWGASQKMVEIGHLVPGDEIEIWIYRKGFTYALLYDQPQAAPDDSRYIPPMKGHFYDIVPFWSNEPIALKCYSVSVPTSKNLQYQVFNAPEPKCEKGICSLPQFQSQQREEGDRTIYTFTMTDISPLTKEPSTLADNDIQCKLLLSTAADWQSKSRWFYGVNEDYGSFKTTPEVTAKVRELLQDAQSEIDSISILTHWVADNIRYCGISMGEGEGYTLHNAEMNFTDRCGVCKDKAGMLITMLRAAGFKAYAAMTMAGERIDRIPADQFNHSVCAVVLKNGNTMMLDPTWVPNVRELWSSAEQQQGYLIGSPKGEDLMYTPLSPAENHYLHISGQSKIKSNGDLIMTLTISAEGQTDKAVRGVFSCRQAEWAANLEKEILRIDSRAKLETVDYTDNDHYLDQPVSITYTFTIPHYATVTRDEIIFIPFSAREVFRRAMPHLGMDLSAETRTQPFHDQCSRLVQIEETIKLPRKYTRMNYAEEIFGIVHPAANYSCGFQLDEKGRTLTFNENVMLNKRIYDAADYPAFRATVLNQKKVASTPVILTVE